MREKKTDASEEKIKESRVAATQQVASGRYARRAAVSAYRSRGADNAGRGWYEAALPRYGDERVCKRARERGAEVATGCDSGRSRVHHVQSYVNIKSDNVTMSRMMVARDAVAACDVTAVPRKATRGIARVERALA